jgi:hypothetical protein
MPEILPPGEKHPVLLTTVDPYIDLGTAFMAQYLDKSVASRVEWRFPRLGSRDFDLVEYLAPRWFVTRGRGSHYLAETTRTTLGCLQDLIHSPDSPLRNAFARRLEMPVMLWDDSTPADVLSLYERIRPVTRDDRLSALRWVEPRFRDTPGHAELLGQIAELERPTGLLPLATDVRLVMEGSPPEYCRPKRQSVALAGDSREALFQHPPPGHRRSEFVFPGMLVPPERARFRIGFGLADTTWDPRFGDGVEFSLDVVAGGQRQNRLRQYIDPKHVTTDRRWHDRMLDLSAFAGKEVSIILITSPGPRGDNAFDHAYWSGLTFVAPAASGTAR